MLTRIFGRKKSGKTAYCFKVIKKCIENKKKCFVIVPEQFSFAMEKKIAEDFSNSGSLYTEVYGFSRLANRVFRSYGGIAEGHLTNSGKLLCMSKALFSVKDELCEYKRCADDLSFAKDALSMTEEFSVYRISSDKVESVLLSLEEENPALSSKLKDISLISSAYRLYLNSFYGTNGDALDAMCSILEKNCFFGDCTVVIDSFYGFTPQELDIIRQIIKQADDVYISFCTSKNDKDPIFERSYTASEYIKRIADELSVDINDVSVEASAQDSDISHIEKSFSTYNCIYSTPKDKKNSCGNVRIVSCKNPIYEARAAAALISNFVKVHGARYRDIALCARNIEDYDGLADIYLERAGIPFNFSKGEDVLTKPLIAYITFAMEFLLSWKSESFLRLIKTGLFRISFDEISLLENYVRTWKISGKGLFLSDWFMNPEGYTEEFTSVDEDKLNLINNAKEKVFDALIKFRENLSDASCGTDICAAVYSFMTDSNYTDSAETDEESKIWNCTVKVLDDIAFIYGNDAVTPKRFCDIFKSSVKEYDINDIPDKSDAVLIGAADLIRTGNVKYVIVLGCNNEYFPRLNTENSIFSDNEKRILGEHGISISPSANDGIYDEFFIAYNIFCQPSDKLYLLYSDTDIDGNALRKSVLVSAVQNMFSDVNCEKYPFENDLLNITSEDALADDIYCLHDKNIIESARSYLSKSERHSDFIRYSDQLLNENGILSADTTVKLFGDTVNSSPSRFETYSKCRFSYFNSYLLKIRPEKRAELDSIQTGLISHKVIELFVKELSECKKNNNMPSYNKAKSRIKELLDIHLDNITHTKGRKDVISKRFIYLYKRLYAILSELAVSLVDEVSESEFLPVDFEASIGFSEGTIKTVPIDIKDKNGEITGRLNIVGQVDRVDAYSKDGNTYIRIIDYKTGSKTFKAEEIAYGFNMQMLLYLYCMQNSETKKYGENIIPAGVLYIPVKRPKIGSDFGESTKDRFENSIASAFKGDGILISDIDILSAMEPGLKGRFIPVGLKKDGTFDRYSKQIDSAEMGKLLKKAADVASKLSSLMLGGNIQVNPYKCDYSSCSYCDYAAVCRLDRKNNGIRYEMEKVE